MKNVLKVGDEIFLSTHGLGLQPPVVLLLLVRSFNSNKRPLSVERGVRLLPAERLDAGHDGGQLLVVALAATLVAHGALLARAAVGQDGRRRRRNAPVEAAEDTNFRGQHHIEQRVREKRDFLILRS